MAVFSVLLSMDYARLGKMSNPEFLRGLFLDRSYFSYMSMICQMLQPDQCLLMIQSAINVLNQSHADFDIFQGDLDNLLCWSLANA